MSGVSESDSEAIAVELRRLGGVKTWPMGTRYVVRHVLAGLVRRGYAIRQERKEGARLVPVWMSDEIYLDLIGGSTPIRPMKLVPTRDGGFDLVLQAVPA